MNIWQGHLEAKVMNELGVFLYVKSHFSVICRNSDLLFDESHIGNLPMYEMIYLGILTLMLEILNTPTVVILVLTISIGTYVKM